MNALPLSVLIVDDEAPARSRLRELLADAAAEVPNAVVAEAPDGRQAVAALSAQSIDLALVDIRMPTMDGIEFARHVGRLPHPPAIVFVTAYDSYAVQAFELDAIDYLLKPVRLQRLVAALQKVRERRVPLAVEALARIQARARSHLSCHERGRLLLIPVADILYLKADLKYVTARTPAREYVLDESLAHLENEFGARFVRLHRSVLVASDALVGFERADESDADAPWRAVLRDVPERLPVSRRQWSQVRLLAASPRR